jgi:hypothetical protein
VCHHYGFESLSLRFLSVPSSGFGVTTVYRLFIDEVGNDHLGSADHPNERYLCLLGVILDLEYADGPFTDSLNALKLSAFDTKDVVLHRRELVKKTPAPFDMLVDPKRQKAFDDGLLQLLTDSQYIVIAVMIDKKKLIEKYTRQFNPYHYCLTAMIERYVNWLNDIDGKGDVLAEARDKKPNKKLKQAYKYLYNHGTAASTSAKKTLTSADLQRRLNSGEIKLKDKKANIAGLQLADLIANPARRHLICHSEKVNMNDGFARKIAVILVKSKYRRAPWNGK